MKNATQKFLERLDSSVRKVNALHVYLCFLVYYYIIDALRPSSLTGDEPHYAVDAYSIAHQGSRQVLSVYNNAEVIKSIYGSPDLSPHLLGDMTVTFHGVGLSLLLIPAALFLKVGHFFRVEMIFISAIVPAASFYLAKKIWKPQNSIILLGAAIVFALPPWVFYTNQIYPEIPAAALGLLGTILILRKSFFAHIIASVLVNYLLWIHIRFITITFALLLCFYLTKKGLSRMMVLAITIGNFLLYLFYNNQWYGTLDIFFQRNYIQANLTSESHASVAYRTLFGHFFSGAYGAIPWNPLLALALIGLIPILKGILATANYWVRYSSLGFLAYLFQVAYGGAVGGLVFPARYMIIILPLFFFGLIYFLKYLSILPTKVKSFSIVFIVCCFLLSFSYIPLSYFNINNLYGRGDFQDQPLVPLARDVSNIWPDYSSNFPILELRVMPQTLDIEKSDFSLSYLPRGMYRIDSIDNHNQIAAVVINSDESYRFDSESLALDSKLLGFFQVRKFEYVGGSIIWRSSKHAPINIRIIKISPVKSEFPDLPATLLIVSGILFLGRRLDEVINEEYSEKR